jgi:hypothetical protein
MTNHMNSSSARSLCLLVLLAAVVLPLSGCSYPEVQASTVDQRPHLAISGASKDAVLQIDGKTIGAADDYAPSRRYLTLESGTHRVMISNHGQVIFDSAVYLGDGTDRVIALPQ